MPKSFLNNPNRFQITDNTFFTVGDIFVVEPIHESLEACHLYIRLLFYYSFFVLYNLNPTSV